MFRTISALVLSALLSASSGAKASAEINSAADLPISEWVKHASFSSLSLSPDGKRIAMVVPKTDRSSVVVLTIEGMVPTLNMEQHQDEHITDVTWVSNERLILSLGQRFDGYEEVFSTGELVAMNYDGKKSRYLFGYRGRDEVGSRIKVSQAQAASATLGTDRIHDDRYVMTQVSSWFTDVRAPKWCRMDVYTGKTQCESNLPDKGAWRGGLAEGEVLRVVTLTDSDGINRTYYRPERGAKWTLVADESKTGEALVPAAWTGKGTEFYVYHEKNSGPSGLSKFDPTTLKVTPVIEPEFASVRNVLLGIDRRTAASVMLGGGRGSIKPLKHGPELQLIRALGAQFPGEKAYPVQFSDDGKVALVFLQSDVSSDRYFLYRFDDKKLLDLGSAHAALNPDWMATTEAVVTKVRDQLSVESYLTLPIGTSEKNPAPLLVIPHGGPFGVRDEWEFDSETQLFASRGYAVLRVNFRGSGGYGKKFEYAGYKQWGKAMQNDLLDVSQAIAKRTDIDANRVAIYGVSYGGYAALMGGAQSPGFYKAVISVAGVSDLRLLYTRGDTEDSDYFVKSLERSLGRENLAALSPVSNAAKIKAPVMLVHGARDQRVPIAHAERMRSTLAKAGNKPEWYVEQKEGHGFYAPENKAAMYTKVLAFLDKHVKNATVK